MSNLVTEDVTAFTIFIIVSVINENVMDLQSALINCSNSSTETEGNRKKNRFTWDCEETGKNYDSIFAVILANIKKLTDQMESHSTEIASLTSSLTRLDSMATRGTWCAYQNGPVESTGRITYDRLTFSDTNMDISGTPLRTSTGICSYSHKFYKIMV